MPLRYIPAGNSGNRTNPTFYWERRHSGTIFDLRPGTEYEIRLQLIDPDGGAATRTISARTRPVPKAARNARIVQATPRTLKQVEAAAEPGDILVLSPGFYEDFTATRDGTSGRPIVIRGAEGQPLPSVFDSVSLINRKHVIFEKATVYGSINLQGAEDVSVRHCRVHAKFGIIAKRKPGAKNCYIADNVVTWVMPWVPEAMGAESVYGGPGNVGEGIQITGPGNVISHNRVHGYRDCISLMEDTNAFEQYSVDIYNNDITLGADDAIEADFCMGNCRVMRNRITNSFMGVSSQPSLGGPTYFIRNAMYNIIEAPFKLTRGSGGNVILHNTVLKVGDGMRVPHGGGSYYNSIFRNNLTLGGLGGGRFGRYTSGTGRALHTPETDPSNDFDYDGLGVYGLPFTAQFGKTRVTSIEELRSQTTEKHAVEIGINDFAPLSFPFPPMPEREIPNLRIRAGSAAADVGVRLPNVNDDFLSTAPDLGAYEIGIPIPHYGPRPDGEDEETQWEREHP